MDWMDLETFLAVAEAKSMTSAAKKVHLAQSAVSNRIQRLESELQIQLFTRSHSGVNLTPGGKSFFHYAKQSIEMLYSGIDSIQKQSEPEQILKVGVTSPLAPAIVPSFIRCYRLHQPAYFFDISTLDSDSIFNNIRHGLLHAGLFSAADRSLEGVRKEAVMAQEYYLIGTRSLIEPVLKKHHNASPDVCFAKLPYVLPRQGYSMRRLIQDMFSRLGIANPHIVAESDNIEILFQMVQQGLGCTILTYFVEDGELPLMRIPISHFFPPRIVHFAYAEDLPDVLSRFMENMIHFLRFQLHYLSSQDDMDHVEAFSHK